MAKRASTRTAGSRNQKRRGTRQTTTSYRRTGLELLESRLVLSAVPTLAPIADVTVESGAPLHIALDGFDADGDDLTYTVTSTNADLTTSVLQGNRSLRIKVAGHGDMLFELFEQRAPRTTARIIELAESGYYDGLLFHRIATYSDGTPFVIQGGDPNGDGTGGSGTKFDDEFHAQLQHTSTGVLSMAKSSDDTNDSQFFITGTDTRHLDFNHSVFGVLTEGESVQQAIQSVETDSNSKPVTDVVMESVTVEYDNENGTLMLSAPDSAAGEADVTVTVTDADGNTAVRTFHITIQADTNNAPPFLQDIDWIETTAGESTGFTIPATDIEGDSIYYAGMSFNNDPSLSVNVNNDTGYMAILPADSAAGVFGVTVGIQATDGGSWDVQSVPVLVSPAAPTGIELLASVDTGASDNDGITQVNNGPGEALRFRVSGVVDGAEVSLYADGTLIGSATATGTAVVIITDATNELADGTHEITAKQTLREQEVKIGNIDDTVDLASELSSAMSIVVDTTDPQITSTPVVVANGGVVYEYNVESDEESGGGVRYRLTSSPTGMVVDQTTGVITWTPAAEHGETQSVTVAVMDLAGNEVSQSFSVSVNEVDDPPVADIIGPRRIFSGTQLRLKIDGRDPDVPANAVTYGFEGDVPNGATIDANTGVITWNVPVGYGSDVVEFNVRITEIVPEGQTALSTVIRAKVGVIDIRLLALVDAAMETVSATVDSMRPVQGLEELAYGGFLRSSNSDVLQSTALADVTTLRLGDSTGVLGVSIRDNAGLGDGVSSGSRSGEKDTTQDELDKFDYRRESKKDDKDDESQLSGTDNANSVRPKATVNDRVLQTWHETEIIEAPRPE